MKKIFLLLTVLVFSLSMASEKNVKLSVSGLCCDGCGDKIEAKLKTVDGVKSANVDFKSNTIEIKIDEKVKTDNLISAVSSVNKKYVATVFNDSKIKSETKDECKDDHKSGKDAKDCKAKDGKMKDCCKKKSKV